MSSQGIPGNRPKRKRIGELLIEAGLLTETDFAEALAEAQKAGLPVGHVLVQKGRISREQLGKALSIQYGAKYLNISALELDPALIALLPGDFMRLKKVLPIAREGGRLVVAMVDPADRSIQDEITFITGMRPQAVVTTHVEFQECLIRAVGVRSANTLIEEISATAGATNPEAGQTAGTRQYMASRPLDMTRAQRDTELADETNPLVKLVHSFIVDALDRNASDIHIEPRHKKVLIRFRLDGMLRTGLVVPQNMESSLVTRIKVLARMDIAEHRRPQDGRILFRHGDKEYNLRVNTLPVTDNREKIAIRILRPFNSVSDFPELGLEPEEIDRLERLYRQPHGVILICGPTGSGKTTTLYTILSKLNAEERNISTVEDPVELCVEGLNQSQVNPKADYTFATSIRSLLRQDPDILMVGEIRDYETLEAAIQAALTGHLVFSTLHSNTTASTLTRLIEMGATPNLISAALVGLVAQRLLRAICSRCREPYEARPQEKMLLFPYDESRQVAPLTLYRGRGCDHCAGTGYSGRTGIYEILAVDREIRHLISIRSSDLEIEDAAVASGMRTLPLSGRSKVVAGVTTIDELVRVLGLELGG